MKWSVTYGWILFLFVAVNGYTQNLNFSGGSRASVLLCKDGHVYVSGANDFGQLGRGGLPGINSPDIVSGIGGFGTLTHIKQVAGKQHFSVIALSSTGDSVITWGDNSKGQLGSNLYGNGGANNNKFPYRVVGVGTVGYLTGVKYVTMGAQTAYAVMNSGKVVAWGSGGFGALGNGTNGPDMISPVYVMKAPGDTLKNVVSITAGNDFAIALLTDGTVWGWGQNNVGQIAQNSNVTSLYAIPVKGRNGIGFLNNIVSVSCSDAHVLALSASDTLWAWGENNNGQLGNNTNTNALTPVVTLNSTGSAPLRNVRSIATGDGFSMALRVDSTISVWGNNSFGRFGNNTTISSLIPTKVLDQFGIAPIRDIVQISTGQYFSLAQRKNGMLWAWGDNSNGQLAMGDNTERYLPDTVTMPCIWSQPPVFVKGTISGPSSVCSVTNSGTVTLAGNSGSVVGWHASTNNFTSYVTTSSTLSTFNFTNIPQKTSFRAVIRFNDQILYSDSMVVQVTPPSVGGALSGPATVCATANTGSLTLTGYTGTITGWESSVDSFATAGTPIAYVNPTYTYTNLASTLYYRVGVKNGICPAVNSPIVKITVHPTSVGGTLSSSALVCASSNGAALTLSGQTGSIVQWESSTDNFSSVITPIVNTTNTYSYSNLTNTTQYRTQIKSGVCATTYSNVVTIAVDPISSAGTLSAPATICGGTNSGNLSLGASTGSILQWESSPDNFSSVIVPIANTTNSYSYTNLTTSEYYRVLLQSGVCPSVYSNTVKITVDAPSVGGTLSSSATVCSSSNGAALNLVGQTGSILQWESSTDNFSSIITPITNTTNTYSYSNLAITTQYRTQTKSGVCAIAYSNMVTIAVDQAPVTGTLGAPATVCSGVNSGTLSLTGSAGPIVRWESSTDNFSSVIVPISNITTTHNYTNLTASEDYRVLFQNGVCPSVYSNSIKITVDASSVGGTLSSSATVCSSSNGAVLTLSGQTGNILQWQSSTDNFSSVITPIVNTTNTYGYSNLTNTTQYRTQIKSGVCLTTYSNVVTITVDQAPVAGALGAPATVCAGTNSGTLFLSGSTGPIVQWESSTDNFGAVIVPITNNTTSNNYTNLTTSEYYRVLLQNGVCPSVYSNIVKITVDSMTLGGTVSPGNTVCFGTNSGSMNLTGKRGNILRWEYSSDNFSSFVNPIANTAPSNGYSNLTVTTYYRAVIQNGVCPLLYSTTNIINVDPVSSSGALSPSTMFVCSGTNSGVLTLTSQVGAILGWESSTDNFSAVITPIGNLTDTESFTNLTATTYYRVKIQSGVCPMVYSPVTTISVTPVSVGGSVSGSTTVCYGINTGNLNLTGQTGSILRWEYSTDGFVSDINVLANTTAGYTFSNLITATQYRARVRNGVCPGIYSAPAVINVDVPSVPGPLGSPATVCSGSNISLAIGPSVGAIVQWESSTDNFVTITNPIANTTSTFNFSNITTSTSYRVRVKNGVCNSDVSNVVKITVDAISVGGSVTTSTSECSGTNAGTLNLAGQNGTILRWESSTDNFSTINSITNTGTTQTYSNLTVTTQYRAVVQNGVCSSQPSTRATITIYPVSVGGVIDYPDTVCFGFNSGTLSLTGHTGTILYWESSTDNFASSTTIANVTPAQNYSNLVSTTYYRVQVKNGNCAAQYSSVVEITVNPNSVGGTITGSDTVCVSSNGGTLSLSGYLGVVVQWETSTDNFATVIVPVSNTTDEFIYSNLTTTTYFRAQIQNTGCAIAYPSPAVVKVDPVSTGGTLTAPAVVCASANSGRIKLAGYAGDILRWETSFNNFTTYAPVTNTKDSIEYLNLVTTTYYRAVVKSGVCATVYSNVTAVTVNPASVGGTIIGAQNICVEGNSSSLILSGYSGAILQWETSTNNFIDSDTLINTTNTFPYSNLTTPLSIRVLVQYNPCPAAYSGVFNFIINPATAGGIITGNTQVKKGESSGPLTLINFTGAVIEWLYSADTSLGWSTLAVTSNVYMFPLLDSSVFVKTRVKSGNCIDRFSLPFYIHVVNEINTAIKIYPTISPNSDHINDEWIIDNISFYPSNKVRIFNRWGDMVYEERGYDNSGKVWRGQSNTHFTISGHDLPEGTYFYLVDPGNGTAEFSGYVVLNR